MSRTETKPSSQKVIGLSLEYCIVDIVNGVHNYDDVIKVITRTAAPTDQVWAKMIKDDYRPLRWAYTFGAKSPKVKQAVRLANRLRVEGKLEQPRLTHGVVPRSGPYSRWVTDESQIQWVDAKTFSPVDKKPSPFV